MMTQDKSCLMFQLAPTSLQARNHSVHNFCINAYINGAFQKPLQSSYPGTSQTSVFAASSPILVPAASEKPQKNIWVDFVMGGVSTGVHRTAVAPIERVKLLIQNQNEMLKTGRLSKPYMGISDCFSRTIKSEGLLSFWRGNTATIMRYFPAQAMDFAFRDRLSKLKEDGIGTWKLMAKSLAICGSVGATAIFLVYPFEYARTRLATDVKTGKMVGGRQFNGLGDVYKKTLQLDGVVGLYRGFPITCIGCVSYRALYFGMYEPLKPVVLAAGFQDSLLACFMLGWSVAIAAGIATYPIDTVRRRMMMTSGEAIKYKSSIHAFKQIIKTEGTKSLFKGAAIHTFRSVVSVGVVAGYDKLRQLF